MRMTVSEWLRRIALEPDPLPALDRAAASAAMHELLAGRVGDLALGAFAIAARPGRLGAEAIAGFLDAAQRRCLGLASDLPVVLLPSYGGAPAGPTLQLTPLLALRLAQEGAAVLVHGTAPALDEVGSAAVFRGLGLPVVRDADELRTAWARRQPAFMPLPSLCPPLARLVQRLDGLGPCHLGRAIATMLDPILPAASLRVLQTADPDAADAVGAYARLSGEPLMLLRGPGNEPVADPRHLPRIDVWLRGLWRPELSCAARESVLGDWPLLPPSCDAATTALYIQAVASGERPAPAPLERQVSLVMGTLAAQASAPAVQRRSA